MAGRSKTKTTEPTPPSPPHETADLESEPPASDASSDFFAGSTGIDDSAAAELAEETEAEAEADDPLAQAAAGELAEDQAPAQGLDSRQEFRKKFRFGFDVAGGVTGFEMLKIEPARAMLGIDSLPEGDCADECADAIYELACSYEWLRFLIKTDGQELRRWLMIGVFVLGKSKLVAGELAERRDAAGSEAGSVQPPDQGERGDGVPGV